MKKLKLAFTMVEIVVALAVIGVIAAMALPMLIKETQKHQSGATLGRIVAQIENGNQDLIQRANMHNEGAVMTEVLELITKEDLGFSDEDADEVFILDSFADIIPRYWGLEPEKLTATDVMSIRTFSNASIDSDLTKQIITNGVKYNFAKFPASVSIYSARTNATVPNANLGADTSISIYVDTTGWHRPPNIIGKDIFLFHLKNNGKLIPHKDTLSGFENTANVVKNGFKITYY